MCFFTNFLPYFKWHDNHLEITPGVQNLSKIIVFECRILNISRKSNHFSPSARATKTITIYLHYKPPSDCYLVYIL